MAKDLILEIGSEEIPAGFIPPALDTLKKLFEKRFLNFRLGFRDIRTLGTPRRLTVIVEGLDERQPDGEVRVRGPHRRAAFDAEGRPTKALLGFARSQGLRPEDLKVVETEKGEYMYAVKLIKGERTEKLLPDLLREAVSSDLFPKSMRWGSHTISFARPLHWILALYGSRTVRFDYGHIKSGPRTYGHRFLAPDLRPKAVKVENAGAYAGTLKSLRVIVDPEERREMILRGLEKAAGEVKGKILHDEALLEEVAYLVEYPVVVRGSFDREFLELPADVVINAMREHQRYFSIVDRKGALLPYFVTVANTKVRRLDTVRKGNERVLRARLNDAKFYFDQDIKVPLYRRVEELKGVIYQAKLGTSYEKVVRFTRLALYIGEKIGYSEPLGQDESVEVFLTDACAPKNFSPGTPRYNTCVLGRSAMLSKADLVTGMVGEFPVLQGKMGSIYALRSGEVEEAAKAIGEHYKPTSAGGELPSTVPGAIVSIADKLDTIVGCFGIGLVPTGAQDPYALRRQALGIIAIILDKGFRLRIDELVDRSIDILSDKLTVDREDVKRAVLDFFKERLRNQLLSQKLSFDTVDAVLSAPWYDMVDAVARIKALERFKAHPACAALTVAFKRVSNILKGFRFMDEVPKEDLLKDPYERELYKVSKEIAPLIEAHWKKGDYEKVFETLASIKDRIDAFFDHVMVMVDDEAIRFNRLVLLNSVRKLYFNIADLSKLSV